MTFSLKTALGLAAGATLVIGYCIYFDKKRRNDPNFKRKLRERRRAKKEEARAGSGRTKIPDLKDHEAVQMFFLQEVQLGEELLGMGDEDGGVEHLSNAVAVCGQPNQLLQVLQQTLPHHVFAMLVQRLPLAGQRFAAAHSTSASTASVIEDGVD